ncbi:hypothetical protein Tco_0236506 [Tanacetum coccineum]
MARCSGYQRLGSSNTTLILFDHHRSLVLSNIAQSVASSIGPLQLILSPNNTPLANRASTSANPNLFVSLDFVEENYEVLESLSRDHKRHVRNEDLRTELDYYSEEYYEEREMEPRLVRVREATPIVRTGSPRVQRRPSERRTEEGRSHRGNLPPLLATHLGRNSTSCITPFIRWIEDYTLTNGLKMPPHVGFYDGKGDPDNYLNLLEGAIGREKSQGRFSPYKGSNHGLLENSTKSPREILAMEKAAKALEQPPRMVGNK